MSAYPPSDQRCPRCQYPVPAGAANCPNCGMALTGGGYPPPPGSGNSYGTLPSSDPYGSPPGSSGGSNYGGQPPTLYSGSDSMNNAPTMQTPLYPQSSGGWGGGQSQPPSYPPPPPGYTNTQSQTDFGPPPAYPGAAPTYPGSQPQGGFGTAPQYPGVAPTYPGSQPQGWFPGGFSPPPTPPQLQPTQQRGGGNGLRIVIIALVVLVILGGGGTAAYLLTRPKPVITVNSQYSVGQTPAGAAGTVLKISGQKFSGNSSITFLLDGQQVPGAQPVESDNSGNVTATLTVTKDWAVGADSITARDASGYATKSGAPIEIVDPGKANTPGPNGAPSNDVSFSLNVTITSPVLGTAKETLVITQKGDSGGTVCQTQDDGNTTITSPGTLTFADGTQLAYSEASTFSCSGTYVGGHLTYTETTVTDVWTFGSGSNTQQCHANPHKAQILTGDFSSATSISGTYSADSFSLQDCTYKGNPVNIDSDKGTFTGSINS